MNDIKLFNNEDFGSVRAMMLNGSPYFCLSDICKILELEQTSRVKSRLKADGVTTSKVIDSLGREQQATFVNESNLYKIIFQSRKPSAEKFTDWVTEEVLPSIRRTGEYSMRESYTIEDPVERALRWVEEERERQRLASQVKLLEPKAHIYDEIMDSKLNVNFRDAAKQLDISQTQFTGLLINKKYVYKDSAGSIKPYEPYVDNGLFVIKQYQNPYNGYSGIRTMVTPKGVATFKLILENENHNRDTLHKHGGRRKVRVS